MSDVTHTQRQVLNRVNALLRDSHELAVCCRCDAVLLFVVDDEVHCWATPPLEGLVQEHGPRQVIKSLLLDPIPQKERQETLALYLGGKMTGEEHNFPGVQTEEGEERDLQFLVDVEAREKRFKVTARVLCVLLLTPAQELVARIYTEAESVCALVSPISERNYEYLFVVAVPTGRIFTFASTGLKPLVATEAGKGLITTMLETNLKLLAEEGDPDAPAREEAAIARAKAKSAAADQ